MIVLSHGNADGVIYTDFHRSSDPDEYETFTTNELFKSIENTFPKSLKNVFLGPCRGGLEDRLFNPDKKNANQQNNLTNNQNSSRVSFEPNMRNLIIFYSTVETTMSNRSVCSGTWLVTALCNELNRMKQNEELSIFLTGIQYRIHFDSMAIDDKRQTPEFKFFSCDRKFIFNRLDLTIASVSGSSDRIENDAIGTPGIPEEEKPRSIHFPWFNPNSKKVLRGRRAVIFHQGEENKVTRELDAALTGNLGFETINVKIDAAGLKYYFNESDKSWTEYGCFAAFFFAEVDEQDDGQVCIRLNKNEKYPIGQLIHRLLGPKNGDWIGKPKLFFLIDSKSEDKDSAGSANTFNPDDFLRATNHYGWLAFILRNPALLQNFLKIFESKEIKGEKSLQESLADLQMENKKNEAMMVSTLPQLLFFQQLQRHFIKPKFSIEGNGFESGQEVKWEILLESNDIRENGIWLLSSLPGSGKSTVMREMSYELQRNFKDEIKVVRLYISSRHLQPFSHGKRGKQKPPIPCFDCFPSERNPRERN
ncbi:uncharacterized protein LOC132196550 [Neocloeon triangulifer]|uniref:uncharacterized protein LOC132196550 n=1 Tax=Neocloeon triangulifer TaxID=2078957 RepID=UPI00286FA3A4|nr:uncharacterized protein LOC132196550 [Neocloeon triangulifer]XP_059475273.1 uncharacterized protein LOC132196550 [Neocloeon triangulifer]XP_059475274.1 uncharacterized protein LOC132196550 [Neocloeon triangulifer]